MSQGIEIFDQSGAVILDGTTRIAKIIGSFKIPTFFWRTGGGRTPPGYPGPWTGSITSDEFLNGTPIAIPVVDAQAWATPSGTNMVDTTFVPPNFTFSGKTLTWRYDWSSIVVLGDSTDWGFGGFNVYYGVH